MSKRDQNEIAKKIQGARTKRVSSFSKPSKIDKERLKKRENLKSSEGFLNKYSVDNRQKHPEIDNFKELKQKRRSNMTSKLLDNISKNNLDVKGKIKQMVAMKIAAVMMPVVLFLFPLILVIVVIASMVSNIEPNRKYLDNNEVEGFKKFYKTIDMVSQEYKNKYNIDLDKEIILSVITANKDPNYYSDRPNEYNTKEDKTELSLEDKIRLLAEYQIMRTTKCLYPSENIRKISMNDKSKSHSLQEELKNKRNFNCKGQYDVVKYNISIEKGDFNDPNSGSTLYWNLVDGELLDKLFSNYLSEYSTSSKYHTKLNLIDNIYNYRELLKDNRKGKKNEIKNDR